MEYLSLIFPFLAVAFVFFWGLKWVLRFDWSAGTQGESLVSDSLSRLLDQNVYHLFDNVILQIGEGTTQIDHIVVSPYGIFVIETKNMTGWIFGQRKQPFWTQIIYEYKEKFQNPLRQNYKHVRAVMLLLGLGSHQVHNVVVFVGSSSFKTPMPSHVLQGVYELASFIELKDVRVFSTDKVLFFIDEISNRRLSGAGTESAHIRHVQEIIANKTNEFGTTCPRCGEDMVERVNKSSSSRFLGCKQYPHCRGTRTLQ